MWAQYGHTHCVHNMYLLGNLGHTPTLKSFVRLFLATNAIHSVLLYACFMSTWNLRSCLIFDLSFLHYFHLHTNKCYVGTGLGMPGCSYATVHPHAPPLVSCGQTLRAAGNEWQGGGGNSFPAARRVWPRETSPPPRHWVWVIESEIFSLSYTKKIGAQ